MAVAGHRLASAICVTGLLLSVQACSSAPIAPAPWTTVSTWNGDCREDSQASSLGQAAPDREKGAEEPVLSTEYSVLSTQYSDSPGERRQANETHPSPVSPPSFKDPDFWDRLGADVDLARDDAANFYTPSGLSLLALGIGAAAPIANTSADESIRRWVRAPAARVPGEGDSVDALSSVVNYAGQFWFVVPLWVEVAALRGGAADGYQADGGMREWGNRSLRAVALGYPPVLALYGILGSGRPDKNDSHWHPFREFHGVSGHTFMGAIPFLTAAAMVDEPLYKVPLVLGSFLTGWSRLHEDRHYFSQVALGWWIAYLAVRSVGQTQEQRESFSVAPAVTPEGPGVAVHLRY